MAQKIKTLNQAIDRMFALVERDHGGCDEPGCSLRKAIEKGDDIDAIHLWSSSGAGDIEFEKIYSKFETEFQKFREDNQ